MRKSNPTLTKGQRRVYDTIRALMAENNLTPTLQEIGDALNIKPTSVLGFLRKLESKGYVRRERYKSRSLELVEKPLQEIEELVSIPILGSVPAGSPLWAEENLIGELNMEKHLVRSGRFFALEVVGESMVEAGIHPTDYVVVRQQPLAENGEIVVALLNGEATVKRLKFWGNVIELRPENPAHQPIAVSPDDELRIVGKVIAIRKRTTGPSTNQGDCHEP